MVENMKVNLLMAIEKDMEEEFIQMEVIMKVKIKKVKWMDLEKLFGQMAIHILVNIKRMKKMDKENIFAGTDIIKENINNIKEKEQDHTFTKMEIYIKVSGI